MGVVVRVGRRGEVTADTRQQAVLAVKDTAVKLSIQSFQTATQVKSSNNQISTPLLSTATHNNHACYFHKKTSTEKTCKTNGGTVGINVFNGVQGFLTYSHKN